MTQLERLTGAAAALLALFGLAALNPTSDSPIAVASLILMGFHGLAVTAFAGQARLRPLWTDRGRIVRHSAEGLLILLLLATTGGASSYFFIYLLYPVLAGALRWGVRGAYWTAVAALLAFAVFVAVSAVNPARHIPAAFLGLRLVSLAVAAALLGFVTSRLRLLPSELRSDEAALGVLLDGLADGVLAVDERGTVLSANLAAARMFRTTPSDLHGMEVQRLASAGDEGFGFRPLQVLTNGGPRHRVEWEVRALRRDGTVFPCEIAVSSLRLGGRRVYVGILRDISSRKQAEADARRELEAEVAEEERVRLIEDLHDGLLQTLTGAALQLRTVESLMAQDPGEALGRLVQTRQALATEQRELRFWASEVKPTLMDHGSDELADRLSGTLDRIQTTWGVATELRFSLSRPLPPHLGQQVYRLVQESVVNAARHGEATHIQVEVHGNGDAIMIEVHDNGRGFPFEGSLSHEELEEKRLGPVLLKHRVRRIGGALAIESSPSGARLEIRVPLGGVS